MRKWLPSSVQDSWVMNKNKTQEKGDGMVKEHLKVFFFISATLIELNQSSPLKIGMLFFLGPLLLLPFLTIWPQLFKSWMAL